MLFFKTIHPFLTNLWYLWNIFLQQIKAESFGYDFSFIFPNISLTKYDSVPKNIFDCPEEQSSLLMFRYSFCWYHFLYEFWVDKNKNNLVSCVTNHNVHSRKDILLIVEGIVVLSFTPTHLAKEAHS